MQKMLPMRQLGMLLSLLCKCAVTQSPSIPLETRATAQRPALRLCNTVDHESCFRSFSLHLRGGSRKNNRHIRKGKHKFAMQKAITEQQLTKLRQAGRVGKHKRKSSSAMDTGPDVPSENGGENGSADAASMALADKRMIGFPDAAKARRKAARGNLSTREKKEKRRRRKMEERFAAVGQSIEEVQAKLIRGKL